MNLILLISPLFMLDMSLLFNFTFFDFMSNNASNNTPNTLIRVKLI